MILEFLVTTCIFSCLSASPLNDVNKQNAVSHCNETQCPEVECSDPIRLDGECCLQCINPGKLLK